MQHFCVYILCIESNNIMSHSLGLIVVVLSVVARSTCETFHIVNSTEECEAERCLTLDQLAGEVRNRNFSDLTLYLLPGKHFLNKQLNISYIEHVKIVAFSSEPKIWLHERLIVSNVQELIIQELKFISSNDIESSGSIDIENSGNVLLEQCTFWKSVLHISSNSSTMSKCKVKGAVSRVNYYNSVVYVTTDYLYMNSCEFVDNKIQFDYYFQNTIEIDFGYLAYISNSVFVDNHSESGGGIKINSYRGGHASITNCEFTSNVADEDGGALMVPTAGNITIVGTTFKNNSAKLGGAIHIMKNAYFKVVNCEFINNHASHKRTGGAIFTDASDERTRDYFIDAPDKGLTGILIITGTKFINNSGSGAMTVHRRRGSIANTSFINNRADTNHKILTIIQSTLKLRQLTFSENKGFIYSINSKLDITGQVILSGNDGGAINAVQSQIYINSTEEIVIKNNSAGSGGGITLTESELDIQSQVTISYNSARTFGGGVYAYQSVIEFSSKQRFGESIIVNNFAGQNGGGVCAVASTIKLSRSFVTIGSNVAQHRGGGLYLQENSKIYLLKQDNQRQGINVRLKITDNSAIYGGGIFVSDSSTAGDLYCRGEIDDSNSFPDCFLQTIQLYPTTLVPVLFNMENTFIINNTAESGSGLYGGLLDRCTANKLAELHMSSGLEYFELTVVLSEGSSITSDPLQVVFCGKHSSHTVATKKGRRFSVTVEAIDQVGNPVSATIHSSVITNSGAGRLKEGEAMQRISNQCTELEYHVFSEDSSALVELYADGPCKNIGISRQTFNVTFLPCTCPIGLQSSMSPIECKCLCDRELQSYITNCSQESGTIKLETNTWIGVANSTKGTGYIIHDCPFDYCAVKPIYISLSSSDERDRQCAFNRSGVLCGKCQKGLSLVLATSKCVKCSNISLLLLIPFSLAGLALVGFILFFNITIATGTIHSLIFYSNLLPVSYFTQPSALTVFISWVNLDLGIETCFYNGMNSQAKVLLQLVFPAYLFLLMFLIIILCRYSNFFATLLSNRNPVAALCTLIFLSYSKLLQFIIAALQATVLEFPNGSRQRAWLYDANVHYFTPSHTPQFVTAVLILVVGGLFTLQLFLAQWYPRCSKWRLMKWTRNTKYTGFMDAYHAPFTRKHRYWVGLLLFTLIIHNVIAVTAPNSFLPVVSMGCIANGLIVLKLFIKKVYKNWVSDLYETIFLLNLVFLAYGTLYAQLAGSKNVAATLANVSMGLSACLFVMITCYHSYKHVFLQSRFYRRHKAQLNNIAKTIRDKLRRGPKRLEMEELVTNQGGSLETHYTAMRPHPRREPDLDVLVPITADDYNSAPPPCKVHTKVTCTVVERELDTHTTD